MTPTTIDNIIHQETISRGLDINDNDRTLTYRVDSEGKLKRTEFYGEGSRSNKEEEIKRNPFYERLAGAAMEVGISLGIGVLAGLMTEQSALYGYENRIVVGTYAALVTYLLSLPMMSYFHKNNAADRRAWKLYKSGGNERKNHDSSPNRVILDENGTVPDASAAIQPSAQPTETNPKEYLHYPDDIAGRVRKLELD